MWLNKMVRNVHHTVHGAIAHRLWEGNPLWLCPSDDGRLLAICWRTELFSNSGKQAGKRSRSRGCWVPGEMHIFVWTIRGTLAWANRVSNDVSPGTTEQPINASLPFGAACDSTSA